MTKSQKFSRSPIAIAIVALWILNDLVLKQAFGNFWTGKISDITGLVAFPFFVCLILTKIFKSTKELKLFTISILLVHSVFAIINIRQDWNDLFHNILFSNHHGTADLEDIFCIPITIPILYFLFFKTERLIGIFPLKALFPVFCGFAFVATSYVRPTFHEFRILYPREQNVNGGESQTFIWYSVECNYSQFSMDFIDTNEDYHKYIRDLESEKIKPNSFSKDEFENIKELPNAPIRIILRENDFSSAMDDRFHKMRFEVDLKINLKSGNYKWCLYSEEKYSSSCVLDYNERISNPQHSKENNIRSLISPLCGKLIIK
jgi:hypothetical protein